MLQVNVGLADTTNTVDPSFMNAVAAAINIQVTRDLPQFWPVSAAVSVIPDPNSIPQGVSPIFVVNQLPQGEGGVHLTEHNQPYSLVALTQDPSEWVMAASHETIEMLIDPSGNRLQVSTAIAVSGGQVIDTAGSYEYLVEACDPCEAPDFGYAINDLRVSDFLTPHFYDASVTPGTRYSFTGAIARPRQLLKGGYITWFNPTRDEFQQILWLKDKPEQRTLRPAKGKSLRQHVDSLTIAEIQKARSADATTAAPHSRSDELRRLHEAAARARAALYRWQKPLNKAAE